MARLILDVTWGTGRAEDGTRSGKITILLLTTTVPKTSAHFLNLAKSGAYSQNAGFYRVGAEFMIQGGLGKGAEKIAPIEDEFTTPLIENRAGAFRGNIKGSRFTTPLIENRAGTVSVANRGPNTGSSEFFINIRGWGKSPESGSPEKPTFSEESESLNFLKAPKIEKNWNHWLDGKHAVFGVVADDEELDFVKELSEISLRTPGTAGAPLGTISMRVSFSEGNDEADEKKALEFLGLSFGADAGKTLQTNAGKKEGGTETKKEPAWRKFF